MPDISKSVAEWEKFRTDLCRRLASAIDPGKFRPDLHLECPRYRSCPFARRENPRDIKPVVKTYREESAAAHGVCTWPMNSTTGPAFRGAASSSGWRWKRQARTTST